MSELKIYDGLWVILEQNMNHLLWSKYQRRDEEAVQTKVVDPMDGGQKEVQTQIIESQQNKPSEDGTF